MYQQRIARDQAPDDNGAQAGAPDEPDNGVQAGDPSNGAASQAYTALYQYLEGNNDNEALTMLTHLMNKMTDGGAMDEPLDFAGQPHVGGAMERNYRVGRVEPNPGAQDAALIRSGRRQAAAFSFNKRFPGAARIRVLG
jgi:hypothetical protein